MEYTDNGQIIFTIDFDPRPEATYPGKQPSYLHNSQERQLETRCVGSQISVSSNNPGCQTINPCNNQPQMART